MQNKKSPDQFYFQTLEIKLDGGRFFLRASFLLRPQSLWRLGAGARNTSLLTASAVGCWSSRAELDEPAHMIVINDLSATIDRNVLPDCIKNSQRTNQVDHPIFQTCVRHAVHTRQCLAAIETRASPEFEWNAITRSMLDLVAQALALTPSERELHYTSIPSLSCLFGTSHDLDSQHIVVHD